jgi:hypothetical protein
MGIEDDIKQIKGFCQDWAIELSDIKVMLKDLNKNVDLLIIRNQVADRTDKEKRNKDTMKNEQDIFIQDYLRALDEANKENRS